MDVYVTRSWSRYVLKVVLALVRFLLKALCQEGALYCVTKLSSISQLGANRGQKAEKESSWVPAQIKRREKLVTTQQETSASPSQMAEWQVAWRVAERSCGSEAARGYRQSGSGPFGNYTKPDSRSAWVFRV